MTILSVETPRSEPVLSSKAPEANGATSPDPLRAALETLSASVSQVVAQLQGPLNDTLRSRLHDSDRLPDAKLSSLAAETVDVLHRAQLLLEPASLTLADHFLGYVSSKCLNAAVERGVPDVLANGPLNLEDLSKATDSRPDRLGQIMRVLVNNGIFTLDQTSGKYSNNGPSTLLLTSHWTQWRNWVELYGNQFYDVARGIPDSVKKDSVRFAAQINFDTDDNMFKYFQDQGWVGLLHRTLGGGASAQAPGIMEDFPWEEHLGKDGSGGIPVLDIGGGGGGFIAMLLRRLKQLRGGVFDLPRVIEHAETLFHRPGGQHADVGDRVTHLIGGDFFQSIPSFPFYTMKWCLHDWKDDQAVAILANIRKAIVKGPSSRLIVLETVLADGRSQRLSRYGDIHMMMTAGGQERTEKQWRELAGRSGWDVKEIHTLRNAWVKAIEMVPNDKGYVMGHDEDELKRLSGQHEWMKASMGGLIHCPVNPKKERMRVLDSGTADGLWLTDLLSTLPATTQGIGFDIATHLFPAPSTLPPNVILVQHSVKDPFPAAWTSSFDLVHQRLVLNACDPPTARSVVAALFALAKPGGWIQLLECDHSGGFTPSQRDEHPATARFCDFVLKSLNARGASGRYGTEIAGLLRDAGSVDVVETVMDLPVGERADTEEMKVATRENLLGVVRSIKAVRDKLPNLGMDEEDFDKLERELAEELTTMGSTQRFHLVYGRRPGAYQ